MNETIKVILEIVGAVGVAVITSVVAPSLKGLWTKKTRLQNAVEDIKDEIRRVEKSVNVKTSRLEDSMRGIQIQTLRLQILYLFKFEPTNKLAIHNACDLYFKKGGNSYIKAMYEKWKKEYCNE